MHLLSVNNDVLAVRTLISSEKAVCAVTIVDVITAELFREVPRTNGVADDKENGNDSDDDGDVEQEVSLLEVVRFRVHCLVHIPRFNTRRQTPRIFFLPLLQPKTATA